MKHTADDMFDDSDGEDRPGGPGNTFFFKAGNISPDMAEKLKGKIERAFEEIKQEETGGSAEPEPEPVKGHLSPGELQQRRETVIEYLLPNLAEVGDKEAASKFYAALGERILQHDITCREKDCRLCVPGRLSSCNVRRFRNFLEFYFVDIEGAGSDFLRGKVTESRMGWARRMDSEIEEDLRFLIFKASYDRAYYIQSLGMLALKERLG